jgi:2',3'-cyclic-nucleotide 2'-phosphodiesterase (5'-nucleotidase family)
MRGGKKKSVDYTVPMLTLLLISCLKPSGPPMKRVARGDEGLSAEWVAEGSIQSRLAAPDEADLVLYYLGEQKGDISPCGCLDNPRGGLPRAASYLEASEAGLVLNGGYWLDDGATLDGSPMADALLKNEWFVKGLQQLGTTAVHVGFDDLIGLSRMTTTPDLPMFSANLAGEGIASHIIATHQDLKIGITGVSHPGSITISTPGYTREDPALAPEQVIATLAEQTDLIVLFNHGATKATKKLLKSGLVDIVIDTAHHRGFDPPFRHGGAIWVRSHDQGLRLGELRIGLEGGDIAWAIDRKIDMDTTMPDHPDQAVLAKETKRALKALDAKLFNR